MKSCFIRFQVIKQYALFCGVLLGCFLGSPVLFAQTPADNDGAVSMVTYFPVSYAAYNNLFVSQKLDIGLLENEEFSLSLGNSACSTTPSSALKAANAYLEQGSLALNMPVLLSTDVSFGKSATGNASLEFNNLLIGSVDDMSFSTASPVDTLRVSDGSSSPFEVTNNTHLFANNAKLPKTCSSTISWQTLSFQNGTSGNFLTCGEGQTGEGPEEDIMCNWKKADQITCTSSWEMYCSLAGENAESLIAILKESTCGEFGTYFSDRGVCSETPTSPTDICMVYEGHIDLPSCTQHGQSPTGNVNWGTARKYTAQCKSVGLPL